MSTADRRGPGRPRKHSSAQEKEWILAAAAHVFATEGKQAATIGKISTDAGVSRQSVYEHFGDKHALFAAVAADAEERAVSWIGSRARDETEPDLRAWARANYSAMFELVTTQPAVLPVLQEAERGGDPAMTRVRERLTQLYTEASSRRWAEHGIDSGRMDTALVAMYIAMTETLVHLDWEGKSPDPDALIDLLTEFTVGGVSRLHEHGGRIIDRLR